MNIQYITDQQGKQSAVIISLEDFQKMQEDLDELHCIALYDEAKKQPSDTILFDDLKKTLLNKNKI